MNSVSRKIVVVAGVTVIPLFFIGVKYFVFTRKGWSTPTIQFEAVFWMVRMLLSPFVILYAVRFWAEINSPLLLIFRQTAGFIAYLLLHWALSFILCKLFYFDPRNLNLFNIIKDASSLLDLVSYVVSVSIFFVWVYFERYKAAVTQSEQHEKDLATSKFETLQHELIATQKGETGMLDKLTVKMGSRVAVIPVQDISYFQSDGPYVKVMAGNKVHLLNTPLYKLHMKLPATFLRVHRSHIVNLTFIKQVKSLQNGDYILELKDGSEIRASRTYREELRRVLGQL